VSAQPTNKLTPESNKLFSYISGAAYRNVKVQVPSHHYYLGNAK
jgi:hypothetical protein